MVLHSLTHAVKTLELLNNQRNSNIFTNFIIYVSGKKFFVHQALVAAHSPVIKRALEASFWNQVCFLYAHVEILHFKLSYQDLSDITKISTELLNLQIVCWLQIFKKNKEFSKEC